MNNPDTGALLPVTPELLAAHERAYFDSVVQRLRAHGCPKREAENKALIRVANIRALFKARTPNEIGDGCE